MQFRVFCKGKFRFHSSLSEVLNTYSSAELRDGDTQIMTLYNNTVVGVIIGDSLLHSIGL